MTHTTAPAMTKRTRAMKEPDTKGGVSPLPSRRATRRGLVVAAAFMALFLPALTAAAQPCGSEDLGTLGGASSVSKGVSADGSVVVGRANNAAGQLRAFRWTAGGGMHDLGTLGGNNAETLGVSADGAVVVGWANLANGRVHAFRWTAGGGMQDLGSLGGNGAQPYRVSTDGAVVVGAALNPAGETRAFRWTSGGGMQDLGTLGGTWSQSYGVSADGAVVVGSASDATESLRAFRWTAGGGKQDLGTLGGASSLSTGVSADGAVVVGYSAYNAAETLHAFRWTAGGGMQDLGTLGGATSSATGVSADGSVVVGWANLADGRVHAFRWTAGGGMQDLGTLGGNNADTLGVSADGSVVVGWAKNTAGQDRAFRWTAGGGMQDLGTLGGTWSQASGVSADGSVVIGYGSNAAGATHAIRWNADTDGDGLPDCWEINGIDINGDGVIDLDLPAMGAHFDRKDIFVEIDAMAGRAPTMADLQPVIDAFDQAPVPPPPGGGQGGIALHLVIDETTIPLAAFPNDFADFDAIKAARIGTAAERADANWPNIKAAREAAFRYCIFADTYGGSTSSGLAELPGNDFMVTLGGWTTPGGTADEKAGTFMHELGHTLELRHGGGDNTHYKPNYYSVMNYRWQTPQSGYPELWRLDYAREALPPLVESALDESTSLGATRPEYAAVQVPFTTAADTWAWAPLASGQSVDWNGDGTTPAGQPPVAADINRDEPSDPPGALTTLTSHDDWANLRYALTGHANFGDGREETTIDDEFDLAEFAINEQIPPPPAICAADLNDDGSLDFFDLQQFLNWYVAGDLRADLAQDGVLDFFDLQAFLNAYAGGCP